MLPALSMCSHMSSCSAADPFACPRRLQMTLERLQDVETSNSTSGGSEDLMQQLHRLQSALSDARRKHADQLNGASLRSTQLADEVSSLRKSCNVRN